MATYEVNDIYNKFFDIFFEEFCKTKNDKFKSFIRKYDADVFIRMKRTFRKETITSKQIIKLITDLTVKNYELAIKGYEGERYKRNKKGKFIKTKTFKPYHYYTPIEKILVKWQYSIFGNNDIQNNLWETIYEAKFKEFGYNDFTANHIYVTRIR